MGLAGIPVDETWIGQFYRTLVSRNIQSTHEPTWSMHNKPDMVTGDDVPGVERADGAK
jgi:hypothetical protein